MQYDPATAEDCNTALNLAGMLFSGRSAGESCPRYFNVTAVDQIVIRTL